MPRLFFLAHRIPYPPEKGEKIRSWHMLDHLTRRFEVELGCLIDDRADLDHLPFLRSRCAHVEASSVAGRRWRVARSDAHAAGHLPIWPGADCASVPRRAMSMQGV